MTAFVKQKQTLSSLRIHKPQFDTHPNVRLISIETAADVHNLYVPVDGRLLVRENDHVWPSKHNILECERLHIWQK